MALNGTVTLPTLLTNTRQGVAVLQALCGVDNDGDDPEPYLLNLRVNRMNAPPVAGFTIGLTESILAVGGQATAAQTWFYPVGGAISIESSGRIVLADLVSGIYLLPADRSLRINVLQYAETVTTPVSGFPTTVQGQLTRALCGPSQPLRSTARRTVVAGDTTAPLGIPQGAYAFDMWAEPDMSLAAKPKLYATLGGTTIVRDYDTPTYLPPWSPVDITPTNANGENKSTLVVTNAGTVDAVVTVRFWLEP